MKNKLKKNNSEIESKLEEILSFLLTPPHSIYKDSKVIHDHLWGSCSFYPWEICLLDTLLLQRLRGIHQLGTAFLTYPSGIHNRFSHTLGVVFLADKLINKLKEDLLLNKSDIYITQKDIYTVRLAGLLHDIGHTFFSHVSEHFLNKKLSEFGIDLFEIFDVKAKPHEMIASLIIKHPSFQNFFEKYVAPLFPEKEDIPNLSDIANIIIGVSPSKEKAFLKDIISGPYDVDKLEYLYRDARTAGLKISYDIERFFYKISIVETKTNKIRLAMRFGGLQAIEQIIFNKMMLFSFVYHHHKVLATDALLLDLLHFLFEVQEKSFPLLIKHPLDCLRYNDHDLLAPSLLTKAASPFNKCKEKILRRQLPKKAFVINREFINDLDTDEEIKRQYAKLQKDIQSDCLKLRKDLAEKIGCDIYDIFAVFPNPPKIGELSTAPIINSNGDVEPISLYFNLDGWINSYELKKLRGYFFAPEKIKNEASKIIEDFLKEEYNLSFKPQAKIEAKLSF